MSYLQQRLQYVHRQGARHVHCCPGQQHCCPVLFSKINIQIEALGNKCLLQRNLTKPENDVVAMPLVSVCVLCHSTSVQTPHHSCTENVLTTVVHV